MSSLLIKRRALVALRQAANPFECLDELARVHIVRVEIRATLDHQIWQLDARLETVFDDAELRRLLKPIERYLFGWRSNYRTGFAYGYFVHNVSYRFPASLEPPDKRLDWQAGDV